MSGFKRVRFLFSNNTILFVEAIDVSCEMIPVHSRFRIISSNLIIKSGASSFDARNFTYIQIGEDAIISLMDIEYTLVPREPEREEEDGATEVSESREYWVHLLAVRDFIILDFLFGIGLVLVEGFTSVEDNKGPLVTLGMLLDDATGQVSLTYPTNS
ncbi:hypothetical protein Tco_1180196 [Tanacetum coccineum]